MNILEFINLLLISDSHKRMQFKIVQLQLQDIDQKVERIYFGDADEFVHARLLEEALTVEKINNPGTERLHNNREVCARKGTKYECLGMGRCTLKILTSKKSNLWLFNFFGYSEYNLKIDFGNIETRVNELKGNCDEIIIEKQHGGGLYNWLPTENRVNVRIRKNI